MEATDVATEIITEMISQLPFSQAVERTTIRNLPPDVITNIADLVEEKNKQLKESTPIKNLPPEIMTNIADLVEEKNRQLERRKQRSYIEPPQLHTSINDPIRFRREYDRSIQSRNEIQKIRNINNRRQEIRELLISSSDRQPEITQLLMDLSREQ